MPHSSTEHAWDDTALDAALAEVADHHLRPAATILAECRADPELRSLRVAVLAERLVGHGRWVLGSAGEDPDLRLLAGAVLAREAVAILGGPELGEAPRQRIAVARGYLRRAAHALDRASAALPGDAVPLEHLMLVAHLLEVDREQVDAVWERTRARCATLYSAHRARLTVLAGDEAAMLAFARERAERARSGDPRLALIALAHVEIARRLGKVAQGASVRAKAVAVAARRRHLGTPKAAAVTEIGIAAQRWLRGGAGHPRALEIHAVFAAVFTFAGDSRLAEPHVRALGGLPRPVLLG